MNSVKISYSCRQAVSKIQNCGISLFILIWGTQEGIKDTKHKTAPFAFGGGYLLLPTTRVLLDKGLLPIINLPVSRNSPIWSLAGLTSETDSTLACQDALPRASGSAQPQVFTHLFGDHFHGASSHL